MAKSPRMFGAGNLFTEGNERGLPLLFVFLVSHFFFAMALTCLYLSMRGIMKLGGYVASGGPYAVTHPAPAWAWVMPVSIILGLLSVFISFGTGKKLGGLNIMALSWSAVCLSLGWNFLESGIKSQAGEGPDWTYAISGVVIILLGIIPLMVIIQLVREWFQDLRQDRQTNGQSSQKRGWIFSLILQLLAVGSGIFSGILFFKRL